MMPARQPARLARYALPLCIALALLGALAPRAMATRVSAPAIAAAEMNAARAAHTATALADGRVLVVGGYYGPPTNTPLQTLATAELYDPAADRWHPAAPMALARQEHTATLLRDGRVLIVGGAGPGAALLTATATAELYDPATDRWTTTGSLHTTRWGHRAVALADGRVMVVNGSKEVFGGYYTTLDTAEIYDPAAGTWAVARPMAEKRLGPAVVTLADGRILVVGGRNRDNSQNLQTAEIYDPATDRWSATTRPTGFIASSVATLLPDAEVLITGTDEPLRYDPRADRWSRAGAPPVGNRILHTATLLPSGGVLVVGGNPQGPAIERYDPITEEWEAVGELPITRDHTATALPDGRVLITGGKVSLPTAPLANAWLIADPTPHHCSAETGACTSGRFLDYWRANGALARNGLPLGPVRSERLEDGRTYRVQYFERVRLEYHPENAAPYDVLLGQFGRQIHPADPPVAAIPGAAYDPATGHNIIRPAFAEYYAANGGLAQFGHPLSEEFVEKLEDGTRYFVQYFERTRFEWHPENRDPQYRVLLGQFGRRIYNETGGATPAR
jgi:N-acetylneuraminic acid mutarotase